MSATRKYRILASDPLHPEALARLEAEPDVEVVHRPGIDRGDLLDIVGEFDALLIRSRTRVDRELLDRAGRLRVIGRAGTGLDNVDLSAARERGVLVLNTPGANANAVAELTLGLMIALNRQLDRAFREREKPKRYGRELRGQALGIVGLGQVGSRVAELAHAFGMRVRGYDVLPEAGLPGIVERVPLEDLLAQSDGVTLHVPLTEGTRGLLGGDAIARMREGAWLVNTARAGVVDERAILQALDAGKLSGYAADVWEDPRLPDHPRVITTPHIGAQTEEAQRNAGVGIVERVLAALRENCP